MTASARAIQPRSGGGSPGEFRFGGAGVSRAYVAAVEVRVPLANGREPQSRSALGGGPGEGQG